MATKIKIFIALMLICWGCGSDKVYHPELHDVDTSKFKIVQKDSSPKPIEIFITQCLVSHADGMGGYYSRGSILFNADNATKGYRVDSKIGGIVLISTFCLQKDLNKTIEEVRYESLVRDSLVMKIKIK